MAPVRMNEFRAEITVFKKGGGPQTKRIALRDGESSVIVQPYRTVNGVASFTGIRTPRR